eukprot:scaffold7349_cov284-Alexandrium_tamarense.AAC.5
MNTTIISSSIHTFRHRETQRTLAANALYDINADGTTGTTQRGLGRLEDGIGYFPSLAALQFQSAVPGPSPSVAAYENQERERLDRILKLAARAERGNEEGDFRIFVVRFRLPLSPENG